jgi:diguanylate cyclase (GGDEF)-like protein
VYDGRDVKVPRARHFRLFAWTSLAMLALADARLASTVPLALLYFFPLSLAALGLPRREAVALALTAAAARLLFGAVGDPLGLESATYHAPTELLPLINGTISVLAYLGVALVLGRMREQERRLRELDREVETDPLTGVGNRRALERLLESIDGRQLAVLAIDLDHFKRVNDRYGHTAGDHVLRDLASRLQSILRSGDLVTRTGGEEFVVLLPGADGGTAGMVAERVMTAVRRAPFSIGPGQAIEVTVSVGCAAGPAGPDLVTAADRALYRAKDEGRDRVVAA